MAAQLCEKELVEPAGEEQGIRVTVDAENGTITIEDDGVGMTEDEVIQTIVPPAGTGKYTPLERLSYLPDFKKWIEWYDERGIPKDFAASSWPLATPEKAPRITSPS